MRSKTWVDTTTGLVDPKAFYRRKPTPEKPGDPDGLSVGITPQTAVANLTKKHGVASLHVGHVRNLTLDVVQDSDEHANITGVPYVEDDQELADHLAAQLAQQARFKPQAEIQFLKPLTPKAWTIRQYAAVTAILPCAGLLLYLLIAKQYGLFLAALVMAAVFFGFFRRIPL